MVNIPFLLFYVCTFLGHYLIREAGWDGGFILGGFDVSGTPL